MNESRTIQSEFRKFGENVSVLGVPRIFKSQATVVRVCWLIAVLASSALLLWQLSAVFIIYYSYPVSTSFEEGRDSPVFPDVTVCNLNLVAVDEVFEMHKLSDYKRQLGSVINSTNVTMADLLTLYGLTDSGNWTKDDLLRFFQSDLFSAYSSNFPMNDEDNLFGTNTNQNLIADVVYYDLNWSPTGGWLINNEIEPIWSAEYFKCYTLKIPDKEIAKTTPEMSVIMYINDFVNSVDKDGYYHRYTEKSYATGVRLVVHPPGTIPILSRGISIGPGTETTIKVDSTQRTRLHYPYSGADCTDQIFLPYSNVNLYGYENCQDVCMQQLVVDSCHCLYSGLRFTDQQVQQTNSTICGNVSWIGEANMTKAMKDFQCIYNLNVDFDICNKICLFPCEETYYEYSESTAPWPQISQHLLFYNRYIRDSSLYENKFDVYANISSLENETEIIDRLKNLHLIQDNFLSVNVVMNKRYVYLMTDKAQMTWEVMLSSIGGCLSFWLGVTIMTLVEVVEFFFTLGSICYQNRKSKNRVMDINWDDSLCDCGQLIYKLIHGC